MEEYVSAVVRITRHEGFVVEVRRSDLKFRTSELVCQARTDNAHELLEMGCDFLEVQMVKECYKVYMEGKNHEKY